MTRLRLPLIVASLVLLWGSLPRAERVGYPPEEFAARRQRLAKSLERGTLVLFGAPSEAPGLRFRQDNDFFYLTGSEALSAVLVMDAPSGQAHVFMPKRSTREVQYEGGNWLDEPDAARAHGVTSVQPLTALQEFLARRRTFDSQTLWVRLSERDEVNLGRIDVAIQQARRLNHPFAQYPSEDALRVQALRQQFPYYDLKDVTPHIDRLRVIKTPREIDILRSNGRISAEAIGRAMAISRPGRFEYELEAEATHWLLTHGMQGVAYPAIVASGPNGNQWHYGASERQTKAGDLVVMDFGGDLDHLTIDITRTWPVSGRFTDEQRSAYECVLEAQKAIIAAIRPGVTRATVRTLAEDIYRRRGFGPHTAYIGHYVGMSVHDVGDWSAPFEAGMVLAIEPIVDLPEKRLHVRIEDTVLVTATGAEVLTGAVPKEADDVLKLLRPSASSAGR